MIEQLALDLAAPSSDAALQQWAHRYGLHGRLVRCRWCDRPLSRDDLTNGPWCMGCVRSRATPVRERDGTTSYHLPEDMR